jgi:hypothetical protein
LARAVAGFLYVKPLQPPRRLYILRAVPTQVTWKNANESSNYREDLKKPPMLCVMTAQGDGGFFCATTRAKEINE